jgi:hypothetical protein
MADELAELTKRLEQLVADAQQETEPNKMDEITAEIWRVLAERDRMRPAEIA